LVYPRSELLRVGYELTGRRDWWNQTCPSRNEFLQGPLLAGRWRLLTLGEGLEAPALTGLQKKLGAFDVLRLRPIGLSSPDDRDVRIDAWLVANCRTLDGSVLQPVSLRCGDLSAPIGDVCALSEGAP